MEFFTSNGPPVAGAGFSPSAKLCVDKFNNALTPDGVWRVFPYGSGEARKWAAAPFNSSLVPYLSTNMEYNLDLIVALTKYSDPSRYLVDVVEGGCNESSQPNDKGDVQPNDKGDVQTNDKGDVQTNDKRDVQTNDNEMIRKIYKHPDPHRLSSSALPYQVEYAGSYKFDISNCGNFLFQDPCWFDLKNENPYEPGLILLPPGVLPHWECLKIDSAEAGYRQKGGPVAEDPLNRGRVLKHILRGDAWHPEDICPDWRLVCGSKAPPNLPREVIAACGTPEERWVQLQGEDCEREADCPTLKKLRAGRLPGWRDKSMKWMRVDKGSRLCKSGTLERALLYGAHSQNGSTACQGESVWREGDAEGFDEYKEWYNGRRDNAAYPPSGWSLVKTDVDDFKFVSQNPQHELRNAYAYRGDRLIPNLADHYTFWPSDFYTTRFKLLQRLTRPVAGSRPLGPTTLAPLDGDADPRLFNNNSADSNHWASAALIGAAVMAARGVSHALA